MDGLDKSVDLSRAEELLNEEIMALFLVIEENQDNSVFKIYITFWEKGVE